MRRMRSLRVTTSVWPSPTLVPWPMPQTLIRQVVRFSGMLRETSAVPSFLVSSAPTQRAVSANSLRTVGWTNSAAPGSPACAIISAEDLNSVIAAPGANAASAIGALGAPYVVSILSLRAKPKPPMRPMPPMPTPKSW